MNIRIGNDVHFKVHLSQLLDINAQNIISVKAELIRNPFKKCHCCCGNFPDVLKPTPYTLHGYGFVEYNVLPFNHRAHGHHGPIDGRVRIVCLDIPKPYGEDVLDIYFKAKYLHFEGEYSLIVHITVQELGYGRSNLHTYTVDFGHVFDLTYDQLATFGDIVIDLPTSVEKTCFIGAGVFTDITTQDQTRWKAITSLHQDGTIDRPVMRLNTTNGYDGLVIKCLEGYVPSIVMYDHTGALVICEPMLVETSDGFDYYTVDAIDPSLSIISINLEQSEEWQQE